MGIPDGESEKAGTSYNVFRDSPLRYLGYANEIGESFRYQFPKLVVPSYMVAFGYCIADAASAGHQTYNEASTTKSPTAAFDSVVSTFDCLIWQSLASVMIPGATINQIVRASRFAVSRRPIAIPAMVATWMPTAMGLGSIPLIIQPIDHGVDLLMDSTYRKVDFRGLFADPADDNVERHKK